MTDTHTHTHIYICIHIYTLGRAARRRDVCVYIAHTGARARIDDSNMEL